MNTQNTAVNVNNLTVKLGPNTLFDQVDFQAYYGQVTGIVGPNGSGKSVFFKILSGFMKGKGTSVNINGTELLHSTQFPPDLGTLIEEPYFLPNLSGLDNLKLLASIKGIIDTAEIIKYLKMFNLPTNSQPVKSYSLGMKKKLGIIQAIMEDQRLVLLDEPMNALDKDSVDMMRKKILNLVKTEKRAIILTSHNADDINQLSDRIYHISESKLLN